MAGCGSTQNAHAPIDFRGLARKLSGPVVTSDQPGYDLARRSFNRYSITVAQCRRLEDVQACVSAAAAGGMPIAACSGGHSYAGHSTPDSALIIDLSGMSSVQVNADGTAVIGAGARLIDVYTALAAAGRCLPAGSCPSVGIAGLTLGGGIGVLSRMYGLTCDRLVPATVVTADGASRTVSASGGAGPVLGVAGRRWRQLRHRHVVDLRHRACAAASHLHARFPGGLGARRTRRLAAVDHQHARRTVLELPHHGCQPTELYGPGLLCRRGKRAESVAH